MFPRVLGAALAVALTTPALAAADDFIGTVDRDSPIVADAGVAAWRSPDGQLVVRKGTAAPEVHKLTPLPANTPFDVGAGSTPQLIYASGCALSTHRCDVRIALLGPGRVGARKVRTIPYRGGGAPAVAVDGKHVAWTVREGRCDVPYVDGRRLDRGHCGDIDQLDMAGGRLASLASIGRRTEARLQRTTGGRSTLLQRESQGEESNYVGAVSLDGAYVYTSLAGERPANGWARYGLKTRQRTNARAFTSLTGAFARDRGVSYYGERDGVVVGADPFTGTHTTTPSIALDLQPQPIYVDTDVTATAKVTRRKVSRTAQLGTVPVAGAQVTLKGAQINPDSPPPFEPVGTAATDASGRAVFTLKAPLSPRPEYTAQLTDHDVTISPDDQTLPQVFVHLDSTASRAADGTVTVSGTVTPPQPGRKVKLEKRGQRNCRTAYLGAATLSPSTEDPKCADFWSQNPLAVADVSADGRTFTVSASGQTAGVYRVSLDAAGGSLTVYQGESTALHVG